MSRSLPTGTYIERPEDPEDAAKCGRAFSERYWRWLSAIPRTGDRIPVLVVGDAPGPGHRRRAFVVIELGDWRDLHGEDGG